MATLRELFVKLGVNTDLAAVEAFEGGLEQVKTSAQGVIKVMAGLSAALAGAGFAMWKLVRQTADAADAAATGAQRYGLTTETFQELEHAAALSGTNIEAVGDALKDLSMRAADAARGGEGNVKMFRRLGVSLKGANGQLKSADELMMDVADRIAKMKNPTEQLGAAVAAFGESGVKMLPMLRQGRRGIMEMREEARELGHVISADAATGFQDLNNNLMRGRKLLEGWRNRLAVALLPKVNELVERMFRWARANREVISAKIDDFAKRVVWFLDEMVVQLGNVNRMVQAWGGWEANIKRVGKAFALLGMLKVAGHAVMMVNGLQKMVVVLKAVRVAMLLAFAKPLAIAAAVALAIAGIALAVEDVIIFMRGGDSLVGRFFAKFGAAEKAREVIGKVGDAFKAFGRMVLAYGRILIKFWTTVFKVWWEVASPFFQMLAGVLVWWWKTVTWPILGALAEGFAWAFGKITDGLDWLNEHWDAVMGAFKLMAMDVGRWIADYIANPIKTILKLIDAMLARLNKTKALAGKLPGSVGEAASGVRGFFANVRRRFAPGAGNNPRTPSGGNTTHVQGGTTNITVNAETNASPEQIASVTASRVEDTNARQMRQTQAAFAGGEM